MPRCPTGPQTEFPCRLPLAGVPSELAALDRMIGYFEDGQWNSGWMQAFLSKACADLQADRLRVLEFFPQEARVSRVFYWNGALLPPGVQSALKKSPHFWRSHLARFSPDGFLRCSLPGTPVSEEKDGKLTSLQHVLKNQSGTLSLLILDDLHGGRRFTDDEKQRLAEVHRILHRWLTLCRRLTDDRQVRSVDPLTGALTRQSFCGQAEWIFHRETDRPFALISLSINHLSAVNGLMGRDGANRVLAGFTRAVLAGLQNDECIGREDAGVFWVLVRFTGRSRLERRLGAWKKRLDRHTDISGNPVKLSVSVGVCVTSEYERNHLACGMEKAAFARKICRASPSGAVQYYDRRLHQLKITEEDMDLHMQSSLTAHRFLVYLQPKYRLSDNRMAGAEALVRWNHPTRGFLMPADFIPLFERNHFILSLDFYMLEEVCRLIRKWHDTGMPVVPIAVNFSRLHVQTPDFVDHVLQITRAYGIRPVELEIEMTESAFVGDPDHLTDTVAELRQIGFPIAMDDFGLGYSSLNALESLPVDILKLDKRFLSPRKSMDKAMVIVREIIRLAKRLDLCVVSEGVEHPWQADFLRGTGCDIVQGFLYSRPIPVENFERMLGHGTYPAGI